MNVVLPNDVSCAKKGINAVRVSAIKSRATGGVLNGAADIVILNEVVSSFDRDAGPARMDNSISLYRLWFVRGELGFPPPAKTIPPLHTS
jgi:hypothetical protein